MHPNLCVRPARPMLILTSMSLNNGFSAAAAILIVDYLEDEPYTRPVLLTC